MRNLKNTRYELWTPPAQFEGRELTAATWDTAKDSVICTFGPSENDALVDLVRVDTKSQLQYAPLILYL